MRNGRGQRSERGELVSFLKVGIELPGFLVALELRDQRAAEDAFVSCCRVRCDRAAGREQCELRDFIEYGDSG